MSNAEHARQLDVYQALRNRLAGWLIERHPVLRHTQLALLPPDVLHMIIRLLADKRVPAPQKTQAVLAAAYVVLPLDAIPESLLGPAGFADDIAAISHALHGLMSVSHGDLAREHWAGEEEVLELVRTSVKLAEETSGLGFWKRVRYLLQRWSDHATPVPVSPQQPIAQA
jgi:uncharacterized membrane protein YkvA (DUF1232 family)